MGVLTHAQIVTEALELAGNTGLSARAQTWFGLVLRELTEKFSFPQQIGLASQATLTSGSLQVGGAGTVFPGFPVRGIKRVSLATPPTNNDYKDLIIQSAFDLDPATLNAIGGTPSRPLYAICTPQQDQVLLNFLPAPDKTYTAFVVVESDGLANSTYSAGTVNIYPNDLTVIQGVYAMALRHQADERAAGEWQEFLRMAREDRVRYGNQGGLYKRIRLSPRMFSPTGTRGGDPNNNGPGWMGPV